MPSQKSSTIASGPKEPKRERGKLRVAALLDAAAAVFVEKGYDAATMTEIAARAHTAIGSLYQFFPSKEALADALLARYSERLDEGLQEIVARAARSSPSAIADALIDLFLDQRRDRAAVVALADASGIGTGQRMQLRGMLRQRIAEILTTVGELPANRAAVVATMILHILKTIPALVQEEEAGMNGVIGEVREVLRLYIAQGTRADR